MSVLSVPTREIRLIFDGKRTDRIGDTQMERILIIGMPGQKRSPRSILMSEIDFRSPSAYGTAANEGDLSTVPIASNRENF